MARARRLAPRSALAAAVALSLVVAVGERDAVAAGSERAILFGELRPVGGEREVGVAHVKPLREGRDGLVAVFANLDPGARYVLALSRSGCSQQPEPAAVLRRDVASGESSGVVLRGSAATELTDRAIRRMASVVLFGADRQPRACGRLSVGRRTDDFTDPGVVRGELSALSGQSGIGIGHLGFRPRGPDSVFGVFIDLDAGGRYSVGLSSATCSAVGDDTKIVAVDTARASAQGTLVFRGRTDLDLKPGDLRGSRSMVLSRPNGSPVACGPAGLMSAGEVDTW